MLLPPSPSAPQAVDLRGHSPLLQSGAQVLEELGTQQVYQSSSTARVYCSIRQECWAVSGGGPSPWWIQGGHPTKDLLQAGFLFQRLCSPGLWATGRSSPSNSEYPSLKLPAGHWAFSPLWVLWGDEDVMLFPGKADMHFLDDTVTLIVLVVLSRFLKKNELPL